MDASDLVQRLRSQPRFGRLIDRIEDKIGEPLRSYMAHSDLLGSRRETKAIKDAVWGMIDVSPQELTILDSPPLQRLRRIRQLGLSYLTYPTSGYSRFEHSLGAMHQAERMIRAIAARSEEPEGILTSGNIRTLRLAALLHDIGHLPLSHIGERYFHETECTDPSLPREISQIKEEISTTLDVPSPSLSECLSLAITLSDSFGRLLTESAHYERHDIDWAVMSIVGRPPSLPDAFMAQIITNIIDADKLDYMFRDAFVTGVPLSVDLDRLLFKLRCLKLDLDHCPRPLRRIGGQGPVRVLGTDLAGVKSAYDLVISRTMLFDRVYLHHKTLAAERIAMRIFSEVGMEPAELLAEDDGLITEYGVRSKGLDKAIPFVSMLSRRQLPRRAFALSYGFLTRLATPDEHGVPRVNSRNKDAWDRLVRDLESPSRRGELDREIVQEVRKLSALTQEPLQDFEVWVDRPPRQIEPAEIEIYIENPDRTIRLAESMPAKAASFAHSPYGTSYVYISGGSRRETELVFLATERVLARKFSLVLGRIAADNAKIDFGRIEEYKRRFEEADPTAYGELGVLRPRSRFGRTSEGRTRIENLARRFQTYQPQGGARVNMGRILTFLDQFPEGLGESMINVLEHVTFLGRDEFGGPFAEMLMKDSGRAHVVPLSKELVKSAAHLGYYFADKPSGPRPLYLEEALRSEGDITFFDDCLISGLQSRTVVQTWFGIPKDLNEDLADPLSQDQRDQLKRRRLRFCFLQATQDGIDKLQELLSSLELSAEISALTSVPSGQRALDQVLEPGAADHLRRFLAQVGESLLLSTKHQTNPTKWTPEKCGACSLGYSNLEQLLVFCYNTPTTTLTPLWKSGEFRKTPWIPLFPRRGESGV